MRLNSGFVCLSTATFIAASVHVGDGVLDRRRSSDPGSVDDDPATTDTSATVAQIARLVEAGCEIVRVTVPTSADADNFPPSGAR
jgi:hypothetical protein